MLDELTPVELEAVENEGQIIVLTEEPYIVEDEDVINHVREMVKEGATELTTSSGKNINIVERLVGKVMSITKITVK